MERYSLDDLNELEEGLGNQICSLLDVADNTWSILKAKEKIEELLSTRNVKTSEVVLVTSGLDKGLSLDVALEKTIKNIELHERLRG